MILIPTAIAIGLLWRHGHFSWMCWIIAGFGLFAHLCGNALSIARNDLKKGTPGGRRTYDFWMLFASSVFWVQWLLCLVAIIVAFTVKKS